MALGQDIGLLIRAADPASVVRGMAAEYLDRVNAENTERRRQRST
jgi:hypothetical protein